MHGAYGTEPGPDDLRARAVRRIRRRRGFQAHLAAYLLVNGLLVAIWALGTAGPFWPAWSIAGWGIGLGWHALCLKRFGRIREHHIEREIARMQGAR